MGVQFAHHLGFRNIMLESVSESAISAVQNYPQTTNWKLQPLVENIHSSLQQMQAWQVCHIRRGANAAVHQLACRATNELISGSNPCSIKHFPYFSWLYEGFDPP